MDEKQTPMLKQYFEIKKSVPDTLLFYRLGDFYELFYEDAKTASRELDLVLTGRSAGKNEKAPMCGVPHHAAENYIQKLIAKGYKVAIVEQMEDPKTVKGLVKRDIVRIITPGTYFSQDEKQSTIIASLRSDLLTNHLAVCDIGTGEIKIYRFMQKARELVQRCMQYEVKELLCLPEAQQIAQTDDRLLPEITYWQQSQITQQQNTLLARLDDPEDIQATKALIAYLNHTQRQQVQHLKPAIVVNDATYLRMDYATQQNLELFPDHRDHQQPTLFGLLEKTRSSAGSRLLRQWLMQPLVQLQAISQRQDRIDWLVDHPLEVAQLKQLLDQVVDMERLLAKRSFNSMSAQDLLKIARSLSVLPEVYAIMQASGQTNTLDLVDAKALSTKLFATINPEAPAMIGDGQTFLEGVDAQLDHYRSLVREGRSWLLSYEQQEREKTGIRNLRIGYNRAFGHYIEISKGQLSQLSESAGYQRRQTLTTGERFVSEALSSWEHEYTQAQERMEQIEKALLQKITDEVVQHQETILSAAALLAQADVYYALSRISSDPHYVRPVFNQDHRIMLKGLRHPVLSSVSKQPVIANDIDMAQELWIDVLTGPNMGGKSTYMRTLAINVLLAQIGCRVMADAADLPLFDQIFTRMGASDDIMSGQSTFMVEMMEAKEALNHATKNSLILFDEIGRGTATYDGLAIAHAMIEYIAENIRCKTVFSTHYHELTTLESEHIRNIHAEVHESGTSVIFLYKIIAGKADKSYGINVARLAGIPETVLRRASALLTQYETLGSGPVKTVLKRIEPAAWVRIRDDLATTDPMTTTPLEALMKLTQYHDWLKEQEDE